LHVIYAQHDLVDTKMDTEGQGVNKPVVRKKHILDALQRAASGNGGNITFQALTEPATSLKPAERVHAPQMVELFATGFARWAALGDEGRDLYFSSAGRVDPPDWSELVPSQCAPRDPYQRPGNNVHSEVNYYAQDRMVPLTAHTSTILHHDLAVTETAVAAILEGTQKLVYACTTQPGHHSGRESYGGYCFINQAALATALLSDKLGKVALLDVDYHAGNGSMALFYRDPQVLFASLHASPDIEYPYCCGYSDQAGEGEGEGSTINVPLGKGTNWATYLPELARVLERVKTFGAKALVVSLGVDTLAGDPECAPLAGFDLHAPDYDAMGGMIRALGIPTIVVQEGGYLLPQAGETVRHFLVGATKDDVAEAKQ
jgi:acetoin utilization deacetylase AcuC-like enzyme